MIFVFNIWNKVLMRKLRSPNWVSMAYLILCYVLKIETNATCFDEIHLSKPVSESISTLCTGREMKELIEDKCDAHDERSRKLIFRVIIIENLRLLIKPCLAINNHICSLSSGHKTLFSHNQNFFTNCIVSRYLPCRVYTMCFSDTCMTLI